MAGADELDRKALAAGYVCVGALRGAHGVKGLVKVASFTENPETLFSFEHLVMGKRFLPISLEAKSLAGDFYLAKADIISSREEAQALKGERLFVKRDDLQAASDTPADDDDFYHADLIGLRADDLNGTEIGSVRSVEDFGAGDLLELVLIEPIKGLGRIVFIPFTKALAPVVDIKAGVIRIDLATWQADQAVVPPSEKDEG